jgi:hypothetical protein
MGHRNTTPTRSTQTWPFLPNSKIETARVYAAFDADTLRDLVASDIAFRQVTPNGFLSFDESAAFVAAVKDLAAGFDSCLAESHTAEAMGDRILTTSRTRLVRGPKEYLMQHNEVVTVQAGRISAVSSVCSGATPV